MALKCLHVLDLILLADAQATPEERYALEEIPEIDRKSSRGGYATAAGSTASRSATRRGQGATDLRDFEVCPQIRVCQSGGILVSD